MQIDIDLERPLARALAPNAAQQRSMKEQGLLLDAQPHDYDGLSHEPAQSTPLSTGESNLSVVGPDELSAAQLSPALAGDPTEASAMQTSLPVSRLALECLDHIMSIGMEQVLLQCQASEHNAHTPFPVSFMLYSRCYQIGFGTKYVNGENGMLLSPQSMQVALACMSQCHHECRYWGYMESEWPSNHLYLAEHLRPAGKLSGEAAQL